MNKNIVYRIQARFIPDSGRTYSQGEVLSSYQKAYDQLVVGPKPQIIEVAGERVTQLEAQLEAERRKNAERDADIEELKKWREQETGVPNKLLELAATDENVRKLVFEHYGVEVAPEKKREDTKA